MFIKKTVNLKAVRQNLAQVRKTIGKRKLFFVVKADAYAQGLELAPRVEDEVDGFCAFTLQEGVRLKELGVKKGVLVLCLLPHEIREAAKMGLKIGVSNEEQMNRVLELLDGDCSEKDFCLHIKINSGMNRLGFDVAPVPALEKLKEKGAIVEGVYSHLRCRSYEQLARFLKEAEKVKEIYPDAILHLASSNELANPFLTDGVRVGLKAYEGAVEIKSQIIGTRRVSEGEHISYGSFKSERATNLAVAFGGYADGVRDPLFFVNGKARKSVGSVCMDMTVLDMGEDFCSVGDEVVIYSPEHREEILKATRASEYRLLTAFKGRVKTEYVEE